MPKEHSVEIYEGDANWLRWGKLLKTWIENPGQRPRTAADLQAALDNHNPPIKGKVRGANDPNVSVEFRTYDATGPIIIPIPTPKMIKKDWDHLRDEFNAGNKKYPTPKFYGLIYQNDPPKRDFNTVAEMEELALRRLGEYVINECM